MDPSLKCILDLLGNYQVKEFSLGSNDILRFGSRICVPNNSELK